MWLVHVAYCGHTSDVASACYKEHSHDVFIFLQIQVYACIYHGDERICQLGNTRSIQLQDIIEDAIWQWNEHIEFDIDVKNIPRGARLCLAIYALYSSRAKGKKKGNRDVSPCLPILYLQFYGEAEILSQLKSWGRGRGEGEGGGRGKGGEGEGGEEVYQIGIPFLLFSFVGLESR